MVVNQRFRRPIVGVGIPESRSQRRSRPCGPTEESRQLVNLFGVADGLGAKTKLGARLAEDFAIIVRQIIERPGLSSAIRERLSNAVISVGFKILDRLSLRPV